MARTRDAARKRGERTARSRDGEGVADERLTAREQEVLEWLSQGLSNRRIAERLGISEHTVKFNINAIYGKLGAPPARRRSTTPCAAAGCASRRRGGHHVERSNNINDRRRPGRVFHGGGGAVERVAPSVVKIEIPYDGGGLGWPATSGAVDEGRGDLPALIQQYLAAVDLGET